MENFINDYFIAPIWDHSGYNIVNTLTYAAIAILAVFLIFRILRSRIKIDGMFIRSVLCFVLLGSTMRVVTDSIDTGAFKAVSQVHQLVLDSHIYDYGYLTTSPGIYLVTAFLLFVSMAILYRIRRMELLGHVGLALWLPNFLLLLPLMEYAVWALPILVLAAIPAYLVHRYLKDGILAGIVAGHALDGAATFFVIDFFSGISGIRYGEQHVFSAGVGEIFDTFFTFYLLKVAIASAAAYLLMKEKMEVDERNFIALVLMIIGFAPGIRDVLRMVVGG
ncbi:MAG: DUF63 family protein [Candidatus Micrarchaeota archaeon]